jgi:Helix-turn-helix domain
VTEQEHPHSRTPKEAARYLSVSEAALRLWRRHGAGPRYFLAGPRLIRYRQTDLDAWIEARVESKRGAGESRPSACAHLDRGRSAAWGVAICVVMLLCSLGARAQGTAAIGDHCYLGGTQAKTSGLSSTNYQLGIVPSCTITVYRTGTQTKATIFADSSGTTLSNPFTANAINSVNPGGWIFWAAVNTGYDVVLSGGIPPNTYSTPVTLTDRYPSFSFSGGSSVTPCGNVGQIQIANAAGTALNCDPNFFINPLTHTMNSAANLLVNALSSAPRALYDPMDTKFCNTGGTVCGLAAALAAGGTAPTQVLQAAEDYGECQVQMGATSFNAINIPLPNNVTIPVTGFKYWGSTSFGGDDNTYGPTLQHSDATQIMLQAHSGSDTITCSNGTTYTPGGAGGDYLHNFLIAGLFNPATLTDIGIWLNCGSCVATHIGGGGQAFGGPAVISTGTSAFLEYMGFPGFQLQGCKTFNTGTLSVSGFTLGNHDCGSVMDLSLDGGLYNLYATDGQAQPTGHPAGPCYPNCAAFVAGGSGTYDDQIFAQVSGIGAIIGGPNVKVGSIRVDNSAREAVQVGGGATVEQVVIDSSCVDTALQAAYNAGTPTGCFAINQLGNSGSRVFDVSVINSAGIFSQAFNQAWIGDASNGFSGGSNLWGLVGYQGSPNNTTSNDWMLFTKNGNNDQTGPRVYFPSSPSMLATGSSINASGLTSVRLNGNTITSIIGGLAGQHLTVLGNGTVSEGNGISNLNGANATIACNGSDGRTCNNALEYLAMSNNTWVMIAGPPNQTPTHANYTGNPTPSNPALLSVIGNMQSVPLPAIGLDVSQIHGPTSGSGQACFEEQVLLADGQYVVSPLACTTVNLAAQTPGAIFASLAPRRHQFYIW